MFHCLKVRPKLNVQNSVYILIETSNVGFGLKLEMFIKLTYFNVLFRLLAWVRF